MTRIIPPNKDQFEPECSTCAMHESEGHEAWCTAPLDYFAEVNSEDKDSLFSAGTYYGLGIDLEPIWGDEDVSLWSPGEPTYICAASGVGKSTLAMQLVAARAGIQPEFLGYPVRKTKDRPKDRHGERGGILYIGADRPNQLLRMFKSMFSPEEAIAMDDFVLFTRGKPSYMQRFNKDPDALVNMANAAYMADTVILDSAKDFAASLTGEEGGIAFDEACQRAALEGIEVLVLHHERKKTSDHLRGTPTLDSIYGAHQLTAGAGSVLSLQKMEEAEGVEPRDFMLYQLKSAEGEIPPMHLRTDFETLRTRPMMPSIFEMACQQIQRSGFCTVPNVADALNPSGRASATLKKKVKRHMDKACSEGLLERHEPFSLGSAYRYMNPTPAKPPDKRVFTVV